MDSRRSDLGLWFGACRFEEELSRLVSPFQELPFFFGRDFNLTLEMGDRPCRTRQRDPGLEAF